MSTALRLSNLSRHFGGLKVLQDVNLEIPDGGIFGLIGPNGAGKTTVFNLITGLLPPTGGTIEFMGSNLAGRKPHEITRLGIARTFQNIRIFKEMSLLENVMVGMHSQLKYGPVGLLASSGLFRSEERRARERASELLSWVRLDHKASDQADNLSYGDQRKLELARALASEPKLLLLDEPVAGMTDEETARTAELFLTLKGKHSLMVVEHDMGFIRTISEIVTVLCDGAVLAQGTLDQVQADERVIEVYLGR